MIDRMRPQDIFALKRAVIDAIKNRLPDRINSSFDQLTASRSFFPIREWEVFVEAAEMVPDADCLAALWLGGKQSRQYFHFGILDKFVHNAIATGNIVVLQDAFGQIQRRNFKPHPDRWDQWLFAAKKQGRPEVLQVLWGHLLPEDRIGFSSSFFLAYARHARDTNDRIFLRSVFDAWTPQPDTLGHEHPIWGTFFNFAKELKDEELFFHIFLRLETFFNPIRHRHRGTLQLPIYQFVNEMKDRRIADEIVAIMHGDRWDIDKFIEVLREVPPKADITATAGLFEGAGRCLTQWLINRFFHESPAEFERCLGRVIDGIFTVPPAKQGDAWLALLCRGHQNFGGNVVRLYKEAFEAHLEFVEELDEARIIPRIREVNEAVGRFQDFCVNIVPDRSPGKLPLTDRVRALQPIIDLIADTCARSVNYQNNERTSDLWVGIQEILDKVDVNALDRAEWMLFLSLLLRRVSEAVAAELEYYIPFQVHGLKRMFENSFTLQIEDRNVAWEERLLYAGYARGFLLNASNRVRERRAGDETHISLGPCIHPFVRGFETFAYTEFDPPPTAPQIAGWACCREYVIVPMLRELSYNSFKALTILPPPERMVRVSVKQGDGDDAPFVVLTVTNTVGEKSSADTLSTSKGRNYMRRLAGVLLGDPDCEYAAEFIDSTTDPVWGRDVFITVIRFPAVGYQRPKARE